MGRGILSSAFQLGCLTAGDGQGGDAATDLGARGVAHQGSFAKETLGTAGASGGTGGSTDGHGDWVYWVTNPWYMKA